MDMQTLPELPDFFGDVSGSKPLIGEYGLINCLIDFLEVGLIPQTVKLP